MWPVQTETKKEPMALLVQKIALSYASCNLNTNFTAIIIAKLTLHMYPQDRTCAVHGQ